MGARLPLLSLFEEDDHVVVNVEANVAISLILNREATSQNDQAMPGLAKFVVEFRLHVLGDIGIVGGTEALQSFNHRDHGSLCHFCVHIVSFNPDLTIGSPSIDLKCVAIVACNDDCLSAIRSTNAVSLYLSCYYFNHFCLNLLII